MMKILCGMEFSGTVRRAFRALGHDAWSCDLLPAADGSPYHIQGDVFDILDEGWDGAIFHPSCTYLTISAEWAYKEPDFERYPGVGYHQRVKPETLTGFARVAARHAALMDFNALWECDIPRVVIENPRGVVATRLGIKPTQTIQPYEFGDDASKATCLWIRGWPKLVPTQRVPGRMVEWPRGSGKMMERWANQTDSNQNKLTPSDDRWAERSKTYPGIAAALAMQLGGPVRVNKAQ
jgi:hypothetical protein